MICDYFINMISTQTTNEAVRRRHKKDREKYYVWHFFENSQMSLRTCHTRHSFKREGDRDHSTK